MNIAHDTTAISAWPAELTAPERTVIVVDDGLGPGHAANAAAVLAITLGARLPQLPGADFADADGGAPPGLFPAGLPVLRARAQALRELRARAAATDGVAIVALPQAGQQTTDYDEFRAVVGRTPANDLDLAGVLLCGPARAVRGLTGSFGLLR